MNTKLLLGSIAIILLLVGLTVTPMVGIRNATSKNSSSPLFEIRRSSVIDAQQSGVERDYIGKQANLSLPLPTLKDTSDLLERFSLFLNRMDERTYERFAKLCMAHLAQHKVCPGLTTEELTNAFNRLTNEHGNTPHPPTLYTCWFDTPLDCFKEFMSSFLQFLLQLPVYMIACLLTIEPTIR